MDILFQGVGNLGADPVSKTVEVSGEPRTIVEMRVYFERLRKSGDRYRDDGGFWRDVTIWNEGLGGRAMKLLKKGSRVYVSGEVRGSQYTDKNNQPRESFTVNADYIGLDMLGLESVVRATGGAREEAA